MKNEQIKSQNGIVSDPVAQNIESVALLYAQSEQDVNWHQRTVETVTNLLGRPGFLYAIFIVTIAWVVTNVYGAPLGLRPFDQPPFSWLQGAVGFGSLLMTTVVLITQNRQGKMAERRAQLDLQVNLLTEQKTAKLIALVEELRRDLPSVQNRVDPEAEAMSQTADPSQVLDALDETLKKHMDGSEEGKTAATQLLEPLKKLLKPQE